jgi:hypothetical protein
VEKCSNFMVFVWGIDLVKQLMFFFFVEINRGNELWGLQINHSVILKMLMFIYLFMLENLQPMCKISFSWLDLLCIWLGNKCIVFILAVIM